MDCAEAEELELDGDELVDGVADWSEDDGVCELLGDCVLVDGVELWPEALEPVLDESCATAKVAASSNVDASKIGFFMRWTPPIRSRS
jgi:hypothetical protein